MIRDTINSIRLSMSERVGNPFLSATLIAAILINWKLSLLLFSDVPYDAKVAKIIALYPSDDMRRQNLLLVPIYAGLFWTFIWPTISLGITAYWYWMRSMTSNVKLFVERKRSISKSEAAELYLTIDSQEIKYLDLLKDKQEKIVNLTEQIRSLLEDQNSYNHSISERDSRIAALQDSIGELNTNKINTDSRLKQIERENEKSRQDLEEIKNISLHVAKFLPGLKELTVSIHRATNFQADEGWLRESISRQFGANTTEDHQLMLRFYIALGLFKKTGDGNITFGDQYKFAKDKLLSNPNENIALLPTE